MTRLLPGFNNFFNRAFGEKYDLLYLCSAKVTEHRTQLQESYLTSYKACRLVLLLQKVAQMIIKRQIKKRRVYEEHCYAQDCTIG